ncbi:unnamed protein product [Brugia pahangi]|uniref:Uncharacterized protein n=1 Tax=Brugia pahangi TaxID=6280 RepID=A0A0N4SY10_BRUPA|nr:unnamed protein product [Brugia pahangi]
MQFLFSLCDVMENKMYSDVSSVLLDIAERERGRKQGERCGRDQTREAGPCCRGTWMQSSDDNSDES